MPKGHTNNLNGRPKGSPNKHTTAFKELIMMAYNALEEKEGKGIIQWAEKNETEFYRIASKLIPVQVNASVTEHKQIIFKEVGRGGISSNGTIQEEPK